MARSASGSIQNTASKGLITEATGLNFPENAWTDALNVTPDNKGVTSRRLGINYEPGASIFSTVRNDDTINTGRWVNVGGDGNLNFVVVQLGNTLYFYEETEGEALSANKRSFTVDLSARAISGAPDTSTESCEFASGNGFLFVTHPYCDPFYIEYDSVGGTISNTTITVEVRDFEGVDDGLEPETKPSALTEAHEYNLLNQGWDYIAQTNGGPLVQVIDHYHNVVAPLGTLYPNNTEQWWMYKNAADRDRFEPEVNQDTLAVGNTRAPKGHYILSWFDTDRSGASSRITTVTERDSSYFRPRCVSFFAGRVWYAGVNYGDYSNQVYFSQIVENPDQIGRCYQNQDPTNEDFSDLLATDGGMVSILEAGTVYKLFATQKSILVFASNGVWAISGTDTTPFKATEYSVTKVSGLTTKSGNSFVDVQGFPAWWNDEGINFVTSDDFGSFKVNSITDTTIKTFYNQIPALSKRYSRGAYDPIEKVVQWVYSTNPSATQDTLYNYNRILSFNLLAGAFYLWEPGSVDGVYLNGIVTSSTISDGSMAEIEDVVDSLGATVVDSLGGTVTIITTTVSEIVTDQYGANVVDALGDDVTTLVNTGSNTSSGFKYLTTNRDALSTYYDLTFSEEYINLNRDWQAVGDGVSYDSFYTCGYQLHTDAQRFGQTNYIVVYSNVVTDASAFLKVIWDYGKVTGAVNQVYRNNLNLGITQTKIMLRGRGRAFQFEVTSDEDKPFEIIGWSVFETQNTTI